MKSISVISQRRLGIVLQYGQLLLSILVSIIYTPIMLRMLGKSEYGIYNLAASTISYLSLFSLGFGASYIRFYSIAKNNDEKMVAKLNGLYLIVFFIIGLVAFLTGFFLATNAQMLFNNTYTTEEIRIGKILMLFLAVNLAVSFPASVFNSYVISQEKFVFQKMLSLGRTVLSPAATIIFLYLGYGSIGMVACSTFLGFIFDFINAWYCLKILKMKIDFSKPDFFLLKDILAFSIFIAINDLVNQLNLQTDKVILGKFATAGAVAVYAVGSNINSMFSSLSVSISSVFVPKINAITTGQYNNKDEQLNYYFIKIGRMQFFLLALVLSGFIFFGQHFILKWAGQEYDNAYWVALLLMAPQLFTLCQSVGIEIQRAKNKHQVRSIVYLVVAIFNVIISIFLAQKWGEIGCAFGTAISIIAGPLLFMNFYYQFKLGINVKQYWLNILRILPGIILPSCFGVLIRIFYRFKGLLDFSLLIIVYTIIYAISMFFISFNKDEKQMIIGLLKKKNRGI